MDADSDGNVYCGGTLFADDPEVGEEGTVVFRKNAGEFDFINPAPNAIPSSATTQTQFTNVATDDEGKVHVSGILINQNGGSIVYTKSDVGGNNYEPHIVLGSSAGFPSNWEVHSRENAAVSLAVDGDNVYVAWTDFQDGNVLGFYCYSHDGGETFTSPISIGDLYFGESNHIVMPVVAASEGNLVIT